MMIPIDDKSGRWKKWNRFLTFVMALGLIPLIIGQRAEAIPNGHYAHPEVIIQPEELKTLIDSKDPSIRIIDVRGRLQYLTGHIPSAVQIWRPDIEDKNHPIPGMMAPKAQVEDLMGRLGINDKNAIIIDSDGPDNGRLWWILAYYGFPLNQMKLLDGGIDAWKRKGFPLEMISPKVVETEFKLKGETEAREPLLCTLPEVKSALREHDKAVLDVRSKKEYLGEETKKGAPKAGRIPGVLWIEWNETLIQEGPFKGYWKSAEEIKKLFSAKGVTPDKEIYMY
jgi:thiosulfate/3-mercaptopyruvate sulfurtransferase